jgi:hypothetical protein
MYEGNTEEEAHMIDPSIDPSVPLGAAPDRREINELLGLFDAPAYIRRARGMEQATRQLLDKYAALRDEWLDMVKMHLAMLRDLAGDWAALRPLLADQEQIDHLRRLNDALQPRLHDPLKPTTSRRALRRALRDLIASLERFNRRWGEQLAKIDLSAVNALREGYNRHYVLEKACALRSDVLARHGFTPLPPLGLAELEAALPLLPVPRVA